MRQRRRSWLLAGACGLSALVTFSSDRLVGALHAQGRGGRPPDVTGIPQASPPQPQSGTALVLGQVVDGTTGQPIAEATVTVSSRIPVASLQPAVPSQGPGASGPLRLITGADGRFVLHDLPKTNLQISATAAGYVNGSSGQARPGGPSRPVEVDDGQRLSDVKIRLWKYGVLTGIVLDEVGEPAVGVSVHALRKSTVSGKSTFADSGSARTDDRGMYRIRSLTPGDYAVAVPQAISTMPTAVLDAMLQTISTGLPQATSLADLGMPGGPNPSETGMRVGNLLVQSSSGVMPPIAPDGRMLAYQPLFYPAASSAAQAAVVTLRSGEERSGLDLQLKVVPAARISGTVSGPSGPAVMAEVRLLPADIDDTGVGADVEASTATTGSDGTFSFLAVPAGQYVARVAHNPPPLAAGDAAANPMMQFAMGRGGFGGTGMLYALAPVSVSGTDVNGVSLVLREGVKVGGRLAFDGTATPPAGPQLQAMAVTVAPAGGNRGIGDNPARPGTDGQFKTGGIAAGRYGIVPTARGGGAWVLRSVTSGGRDVTDGVVELRDADITDVVITYTDKISQINGTVQASSGALPPVTVVVLRSDFRPWVGRGMSASSMRTQIVPKGGTFTVGNIQPGEYLIAALDDADVPENADAAFLEALARVATRVSLREGEKPSVDLQVVKVRR